MTATAEASSTLWPLEQAISEKKRPLSLLLKCQKCFKSGHVKQNCPQLRCKYLGFQKHSVKYSPLIPLEPQSLIVQSLSVPFREEESPRQEFSFVKEISSAEKVTRRHNAVGHDFANLRHSDSADIPFYSQSFPPTSSKVLSLPATEVDLTTKSSVEFCESCDRCGASNHLRTSCPFPPGIACRQCHQEGHIVTYCPKTRCFNCGVFGHRAQICTSKTHCFHCSFQGHKSSQCPMKDRGRVCYQCKNPGHQAAQCPYGIICRFCGHEGHIIGHCPFIECNACHQLGHMAGECQQEVCDKVVPQEDWSCNRSISKSSTNLSRPLETDTVDTAKLQDGSSSTLYALPSFPIETARSFSASSSLASLPEKSSNKSSVNFFSNVLPRQSDKPIIYPEANSFDCFTASPCAPSLGIANTISTSDLSDKAGAARSIKNSSFHLSTVSSDGSMTKPAFYSGSNSLLTEENRERFLWNSKLPAVDSDESGYLFPNTVSEKNNNNTEDLLSVSVPETRGELLHLSEITTSSFPLYEPLCFHRQGRMLVVIDGPYFEHCVEGYEKKSPAQYQRTLFALEQMLSFLGDVFGMEPSAYWFDINSQALTQFFEAGVQQRYHNALCRELEHRRQYLLDEMKGATRRLLNVEARLVGGMKSQVGYTADGPQNVWVQSGLDVAIATCVMEKCQELPHHISQIIVVSGESGIFPALEYCNTLRQQRQQSLMEDDDCNFVLPPVRLCGTEKTLSNNYEHHQRLFDFLPCIFLNRKIHTENGKVFNFSPHILFE